MLHTSDWHLGKQLKKVDFAEDMELFFDELVNLIRTREVDVLLMSGDLFDLAHPSQQAVQQYFGFLRRICGLERPCKVIITGGNHDSPSVLQAPSDILQLLDIHIVGGAQPNVEDFLIPIEQNGEQLIIAAIPYLRDRDVRKAAAGEDYADKIEQMRTGMEQFFRALNISVKQKYPQHTLITMAHLYAQGGQVSESERMIQIGNEASVPASMFGDLPAYVALGHLHRPQQVGRETIRYSGSPIPLSFSERSDQKQVVLVECTHGALHLNIIPLSTHRKLARITGNRDEVAQKLATYRGVHSLPDLLDLQILEPVENSAAMRWMRDLPDQSEAGHYRIIQKKMEFQDQMQRSASLLSSSDEIEDYTELELFNKRLEAEPHLDEEQREMLRMAFLEIVQSMEES